MKTNTTTATYTDVSELCSAIQHIEQRDLRRVIAPFGGRYNFDKQPLNIDAVQFVEFYHQSDGPVSGQIQEVVTEDDNIIVRFTDYPDEKFQAKDIYPGHLSGVTAKIIEIETKKQLCSC